MARSSFERDFSDLHGRADLEAARNGENVYDARPSYVRQAHRAGAFEMHPRRARVDRVGFRLGMGLIGLFWALILGVVVVGGLIVAGVMIYAAFTAPPL